ncbi:unnamed protein product [Effrenium voratum]|nr:unnamed protein product [Effrenium voratum]
MDVEEFAEFLRSIGIEPMKHVLEECIEEVDEDKSGQLDFDEFYKVMTLLAQREGFSRSECQGFEVVFQKFDSYGHDEIDVKELQQVLLYVGIPTTTSECQDVAEIVDLDDSGYIDFQEFLMCMRLFRDRELTELKRHVQDLGDDSDTVGSTALVQLLRDSGYVAEQEVVNEVVAEVGLDQGQRMGLGEIWKFLVVFRQREGLAYSEIERVRQAFHKYASGDQDDEDETREVLTDDMPKILRMVGYTLSLEDQKQLTAQVDIDRSGALSMPELLKLVRFIRQRRAQEMQAVFARYDRFDTGVVSERELLKALKELGCLRPEQYATPAEIYDELDNGWVRAPQFARCVQHYDELRRKQLIESGGYTFEQMEQLQRQFAYYDWDNSGDVSKKELVQLIVDVFPDMAFDPGKRPLLLQIMKETDTDRNGKLDFQEFLNLMRTVEDLGHLTQLQKERQVVEDTHFSTAEVSEFRLIFLAGR